MRKTWKRWLVVWTLCGLMLCAVAHAAESNRFAQMSDDQILRVAGVPRDHWAADAVIRLYRLGILEGYPKGQEPKTEPKKRTQRARTNGTQKTRGVKRRR